ncbi:MAG: CDP-diacylglycerol--serine O-phosphatidyltransferase [Candidatus Thermoplasmatota archaeon]
MRKSGRERAKLATPQLITLANALLGALAIMYIFDGACRLGACLILICIIVDGLDGKIARLLKKESEFGRYLDSLADSISFCLAPAVLLYKSYYSLERGSAFYNLENAIVIVSIVFIIGFGILRLARFAYEKEDKLKFFIGLPTPALAFFIVILYNLLNVPAIMIPICIISFFMILKLKYPKIEGLYYTATGLTAVILGLLSFIYPYFGIIVIALILIYVFIAPFTIKKQISF